VTDWDLPAGVPPGQRVTLPGRGDTFVRERSGPPGAPTLMLLHGLGATGALNWFPTFEPLGERYRVLAIDHRGHGRGLRPGLGGFRLQDCADDVVALADVFGIDRFVCVGYSMGGPISQLAWRRHPDRVAGLVLCATARNFRGTRLPDVAQTILAGGLTTAATALRLMPTPMRRQVVRAGIRRRAATGGMPDWVVDELGRNDPACLVEAARALALFSSGPWIGAVDVPTAVVVTTRDGLVPPRRQYAMASAIPTARLFEVVGDHAVCATSPTRFVPTLAEACRAVTGG
jgi:pimeloyl-ACP methyl ester carboxylesterase